MHIVLLGGMIVFENISYSLPDWPEKMIHYDPNGNILGESRKEAFDIWKHYDAYENQLGYSISGGSERWIHYHNSGYQIGHSNPGFLGTYDHYDEMGNRIGYSGPSNMLGKWEHHLG